MGERTVWGQLEDSSSETLLYYLGLEASVGHGAGSQECVWTVRARPRALVQT